MTPSSLPRCLEPRQIACATVLAVIAFSADAQAQVFRSAVGGVTIDAEGVLDTAPAELQQSAAEMIRAKMQPAPDELTDKTDLRMVSLRGLSERIAGSGASHTGELPDELRCLAGLLRVEYVLVVPERNDIVLAGPGEAWTVAATGDYVGDTTGQPVVMLDDLLVALRAVDNAKRVGVSCSIDPTAAGRQRLNQYLSEQRNFRPKMVREIEQVMGPQQITVTGVPTDSHFARVLVASDYRMKRYAMHLEETPVRGMPSFLQMMKSKQSASNNMTPRWWLACDYEPIARSEDGRGWQLRGQGVKAMTEDEFVSETGQVSGSGQIDPVAQRWADNMTASYVQLAQADPVFGQLRNLMDLSVVAALIEREDLQGLSGCDLTRFYAVTGLATEKWQAPKTVATHSSFLKTGRSFVVTASGGVQIDSWYYASRHEVEPGIASVVHKVSSSDSASWRW